MTKSIEAAFMAFWRDMAEDIAQGLVPGVTVALVSELARDLETLVDFGRDAEARHREWTAPPLRSDSIN